MPYSSEYFSIKKHQKLTYFTVKLILIDNPQKTIEN